MISKEEIISIYDSLKNFNEISGELLIKIYLEYVLDIDFEKIDIVKSELILNESFQLNLISKKKNNCSIYLEILEGNIVDIQLNEGGEYLYFYKIEDWTNVKNYRSALENLLKFEVKEKLTYCDTKLVSATYTIDYLFDNEVKSNDYTIILGSCFFGKKRITEKIYKPWL